MDPLNYWPYALSEFSLNEGFKLKLLNQNLSIKGRIDLILSFSKIIGKNKTLVIDFKTGKIANKKKLSIFDKEIAQLALYSLCLRQMGYENISMAIINNESSEIREFHISDIVDLDYLEILLTKINQQKLFPNKDIDLERDPLSYLKIPKETLITQIKGVF